MTSIIRTLKERAKQLDPFIHELSDPIILMEKG